MMATGFRVPESSTLYGSALLAGWQHMMANEDSITCFDVVWCMSWTQEMNSDAEMVTQPERLDTYGHPS